MPDYAFDGTSGEYAVHYSPISANSRSIFVSRTVSPGNFDLKFTSATPADLGKYTFLLVSWGVSLGYGPYNGVSVTGSCAVYFNSDIVLNLAGSHSLPGANQAFMQATIAQGWTALSKSGNLNQIRFVGSWSWNDTADGVLEWTLYLLRSRA